ncbi:MULTISPECIES: universal stress protein [Halorussus]|uniref:universal stress protein n=1 Tax=Halorussus TaxID=1070314 RepID=UPI00209C9A79|nr:universal stress protein [Halorussus vallis]USZ78398.1 universal stress protein [Halorussus vallis]
MNQGIVVVEDTPTHRSLLREAGEYAAAADAKLLLLAFLDPESYEEDLETLETVGRIENANYDSDTIIQGAASDAEDVAEAVLDGLDVELDVAVAVAEEDERARRVITAGDEYDCDHAFIVGRSRSPTGKAIFGDFAQRVILNFDGYVTTATK